MRSPKPPCSSGHPLNSARRRPLGRRQPGSRTRAPGRSPGRSAPPRACCPAYLTRSAASRKSASRTERSGGKTARDRMSRRNSSVVCSGARIPVVSSTYWRTMPGEPQVEFLDQAARREVLREQARQGCVGDLLGSLPPRLDRPALPPAEHHKAEDGEHAGRRRPRPASPARWSAARPAAAPSARASRGSALRSPAPT